MSAAVFDYRGDAPAPRAPETLQATLAVNDLAIPITRTEILAPGGAGTASVGDARFSALEERLTELLGEAQMVSDVRRSRDLSREGIPSPGFVVQYRIQSYGSSASVDPGGMAAAVIGGILTAGIGTMSVFAVTQRHEHFFTVEARLYRVEDSQIVSVRAQTSGEQVAQYDTAGAELLWSEIRQLSIRSGHCASCLPGGADVARFQREEGRQMARVIFDETAPDLLVQMRNALASRPAAPAIAQQAVTSGGEWPEEPPAFDSTVRARLDERAARILLCANADAAAVLVEWSGAGAAAVSVRDADEDTTGCVRAAVGELLAPAGTPAGRVLHVLSR